MAPVNHLRTCMFEAPFFASAYSNASAIEPSSLNQDPRQRLRDLAGGHAHRVPARHEVRSTRPVGRVVAAVGRRVAELETEAEIAVVISVAVGKGADTRRRAR